MPSALQLNWKSLLSNTFRPMTGYDITDDEAIIVYAPEFIANLSQLITEQLQTEQGKK